MRDRASYNNDGMDADWRPPAEPDTRDVTIASLRAEVAALRGESEVADEQLAQLRGYADEARAEIASLRQQLASVGEDARRYTLDTPERVCFYEQEFYVLSNFSSFRLCWRGIDFDTSEAAYHYEKFPGWPHVQEAIARASSAHQAFKLAEREKHLRRPDWDEVKVDIMRGILHAKASQHEYVRRKLLQTGTRELVENSWRDDFWGWGPNRDGQNMLGKLWMEVRAALSTPGNEGK